MVGIQTEWKEFYSMPELAVWFWQWKEFKHLPPLAPTSALCVEFCEEVLQDSHHLLDSLHLTVFSYFQEVVLRTAPVRVAAVLEFLGTPELVAQLVEEKAWHKATCIGASHLCKTV